MVTCRISEYGTWKYIKYLSDRKTEAFINMKLCMARLLNDSFEDKNVGFFVRIIYFEILF